MRRRCVPVRVVRPPLGDALSEGTEERDRQVLRVLAQAGQRPGAVQREPDEAAAPLRAPREPVDHRLRLGRSAREHHIRLGLFVVQAQIVADDADDICGVVGPARQTEVDLGDGAMTPLVQEGADAVLRGLGQLTVAIAGRQLLDVVVLEHPYHVSVFTDRTRQVPQVEVHLGGDVVRQATEKRL